MFDLSRRFVLGLDPSSKILGVSCIDETNIVIHTKQVVFLQDVKSGKQRYIKSNLDKKLRKVLIVSTRKLIVLAEQSDFEKSRIKIFDTVTLTEKIELSPPISSKDIHKIEVVAISKDNTILAALFKSPDYIFSLFVWNVKQKTFLSSVQLPGLGRDDRYCQISFGIDRNILCINGLKNYLFYELLQKESDSLQQIFTSCKTEFNFDTDDEELTSHCWLGNIENCTVFGTTKGKILLSQSGLIVSTKFTDKSCNVDSLLTTKEGFVAGCSNATFHVYAMTKIGLESMCCIRTLSAKDNLELINDRLNVSCMSISPCGIVYAVISGCNKIYSFNNNSCTLPSEPEKISQTFRQIKFGHIGPIIGLDSCIRKPHIISIGSDNTMRLWNTAKGEQRLFKQYQEDLYSVSFHPSGLHVLVGFNQNMQVMHVLIDEFKYCCTIAIKASRVCKFSNGGQLIAATSANGSMISVYSFYNGTKVCDLKGHNGRVSGIMWGYDDSTVLSMDENGSMYKWNIASNNHHLSEYTVRKSVLRPSFSLVGRDLFWLINNGQLEELTLESLKVKKIIARPNESIVGPIISSNEESSLVFVGVNKSLRTDNADTLRLYDALTDEKVDFPFTEFSNLTISPDEKLIIADTLGTIFVYDIIDQRECNATLMTAGPGSGIVEKEINWCESCMVTEIFLEEKNLIIQEVKNRLRDIVSDHECHLRLKVVSSNEELSKLNDNNIMLIEENKRKIDLLTKQGTKLKLDHEQDISTIKTQSKCQTHEIQLSYGNEISKIIGDYQRKGRLCLYHLKQF